jgi:hypothetical protein
VTQDLELGFGDPQWLLLQGKGQAVGDEEPDEVTGRTNGQVAKLEGLGRPIPKRLLPRKIEQTCPSVAQPQPRKARSRTGCQVRQSFFRRYAVTVES